MEWKHEIILCWNYFMSVIHIHWTTTTTKLREQAAIFSCITTLRSPKIFLLRLRGGVQRQNRLRWDSHWALLEPVYRLYFNIFTISDTILEMWQWWLVPSVHVPTQDTQAQVSDTLPEKYFIFRTKYFILRTSRKNVIFEDSKHIWTVNLRRHMATLSPHTDSYFLEKYLQFLVWWYLRRILNHLKLIS